MYKKFFMGIAAMAALTLVSCSSDDLDSFSGNSSKNEAISFDGYLGRSAVAVNGTRGSVLDMTTLPSKHFGVFGNYSSGKDQTFGANLFNNQEVTGTTSSTEGANKVTTWTYGDVKYWPVQGHIDFLAYAPYDAKYTFKDVETAFKNTSSIDFDVENNVADQKDLLWANAVGQTKDKISNGKVKFQFKHALSRLGYSVKLKKKCSSDATITLKKITLAGSADGAGTFYTTGTIDLSQTSSTGLWNTSKSGKQKFDWDYSAKPLELSNKEIKNTENEYLFVIPQNFSGTDQLYVIVEYDIKYNDIATSIENKVSKQLTNQNFEQGKAYTINLTIGRPIEFDADVTPWTDMTNTNTDIDINSWE